ncbi:hypothetical protein EWM64_g7133 [Hericium alpestre]|uniref:VanZ-like domain-containing protein n=1 Tax=Hericium alpestre TaxID=135208 RepID=A0A4Y9ZRK7_9AGAM|nr:hypothetical protein EWM64_g7133 [Hericium alpestre]
MDGLYVGPSPSPVQRMHKSTRRHAQRAFRALMRSFPLRIPKYDMPLRIRWVRMVNGYPGIDSTYPAHTNTHAWDLTQWFVLLTVLVMLVLSLLGFTNISHGLPVNDKVLHFFCLGLATALFYFIWDVEEEARRIWFWRRAALILTTVVCVFFGAIGSEFLQGLLPYKEFQFGDIVANLLGSSMGMYVAYHLERYYRRRREISRLYRPLSASLSSLTLLSDEEDPFEETTGTQLLPLHYSGQTSRPDSSTKDKHRAKRNEMALANVWDEGEEDGLVFGVGDDSDGNFSDEESPRSKVHAGKAGKEPRSGGGVEGHTPKAVRFVDPPERSGRMDSPTS